MANVSVKLYTVSDDNKVVSKHLGTSTDFDCVIKETTDVTAPVLRIQTSTNLSGFNYCYIERYGRYYFVDKIETTPNGLWQLYCRCDVLMSYKSQIKTLSGTINRSENTYNVYLNDSEYKALAYRKIITKQFPTAIDDDCFILMTVG